MLEPYRLHLDGWVLREFEGMRASMEAWEPQPLYAGVLQHDESLLSIPGFPLTSTDDRTLLRAI